MSTSIIGVSANRMQYLGQQSTATHGSGVVDHVARVIRLARADRGHAPFENPGFLDRAAEKRVLQDQVDAAGLADRLQQAGAADRLGDRQPLGHAGGRRLHGWHVIQPRF